MQTCCRSLTPGWRFQVVERWSPSGEERREPNSPRPRCHLHLGFLHSSAGKQKPSPRGAMAAVLAKREGPPFISEAAVRGNAAVLDYCRTSVSALSGATAGILGLTGLYGFIFYLLASILLSLLLILKAGRRWNKYFKTRRPLFTGGLIGGLFTYVLFWTFLYGMVHVY